MTKKAPKEPRLEVDPAFAPVVDAFAGNPEVRGGRMMASFGAQGEREDLHDVRAGPLRAKLPRARIDELVAAGRGVHFAPGHGRVMWEWIDMEGGEASGSRSPARRTTSSRAGAA